MDTCYQKLDRGNTSVHFLLGKQSDQPVLLPPGCSSESRTSEVETGPASFVNASSKEQLWDLFQDFMRKMDTTRQAPVLLSAREEPLPSPCTIAGFRWTNLVYSRSFKSGSDTQSHLLFNRTSGATRRHHYMYLWFHHPI